MMKRLIQQFFAKLTGKETEPKPGLRHTGARRMPRPVKQPATSPRHSQAPKVDYSPSIEGKIIDGGPGKNVLIRNKYVREDTGTHETLKIVDDSLLDSNEEVGLDPYNTGRFDRAKSWNSSRARK